jgi:type II secretory pathway component PulF
MWQKWIAFLVYNLPFRKSTQLAVLMEIKNRLQDGYSLLETFEDMVSSSFSPRVRYVAQQVSYDIRLGRSFGASVLRFPRLFPSDLALQLVEAEQSATLLVLINAYVELFRFRSSMLREILFPRIPLFLSLLVTYAVTSVITHEELIPIVNTLHTLGRKVEPLLVSYLLVFRVIEYLVIPCILILFVLIFINVVLRNRWTKWLLDMIAYYIPPFSLITRLKSTYAYLALLVCLLDSGVLLQNALNMVGRSIDNLVLRKQSLLSMMMLNKGFDFQAAFSKNKILSERDKSLLFSAQSGVVEAAKLLLDQYYYRAVTARLLVTNTIRVVLALILTFWILMFVATITVTFFVYLFPFLTQIWHQVQDITAFTKK